MCLPVEGGDLSRDHLAQHALNMSSVALRLTVVTLVLAVAVVLAGCDASDSWGEWAGKERGPKKAAGSSHAPSYFFCAYA